MAKKTKLIKNLLTTASAVAVLTTTLADAYGALRKSDGGNGGAVIQLGDGQAMVNAVDLLGGAANWVANDSLYLRHNVGINLGIAGGNHSATVATIDVNNNGGAGITVIRNSSVSSIVSSNGGVRKNLVVNNGRSLELRGTGAGAAGVAGLDAGGNAVAAGTYTGLGAITLGAGGGANDGTLVVVDDVDISDAAITIDGATHDASFIEVNAGKTAKFAAIGGNKRVKSITLQGANSTAIFTGAVKAASGALDTGILFNDATAKAVFVNGANSVGDIQAVGATKGVVVFEGNSEVNGKVGNAQSVTSIELGVAAAGGNAAKSGTVDFKNTVVRATNIDFKADSTLKIGNAATTITGAIRNESGTNNQGSILLDGGNNVIVVGRIGNDNEKSIKQINFTANDKSLSVTGPGIWAQSITNDHGAARGKLILKGDNTGAFTLAASTANGKSLTSVTIDQSAANGATEAKLEGQITAPFILDAAQDHKLALQADSAITGNVTFKAAAQELIFDSGDEGSATVTGNIVSNGANQGIISVKGNGKIIANGGALDVGTGANAINKIDFASGKTLTVDGNANAAEINTQNGISFTQDGTLKLMGDNNHTINSKVTALANAGAAGRGSIIVDASVAAAGSRTVTFNGNIGDPNTADALKLVDLQSPGLGGHVLTADFQGNVHAKTLRIAAANTVVKLSAGNTYNFEKLDTAGAPKGTLSVGGGATYKTANFTAEQLADLNSQSRFAGIKFEGNHSLNVADDSVLLATKFTNAKAQDNQGVLEFAGNALFSAAPGDYSIDQIKANGGAGKVVRYEDNIDINGALTIAAGGKFDFRGGNLKTGAAGVVGNLAGNDRAILQLNSSSDQTIEADINDNTDVVFAGGNVTFSGASNAKSYAFNNKSAITANLGSAAINDANFVVNQDNVENIVKFDGNARNLQGSLGGDKKMKFVSGGNVTVTGTAAGTKNATFATNASGQTLNLNSTGAASEIAGIAKDGESRFDTVNVQKDYTIHGDAHGKKFVLSQDKSLTLKGGFFADEFKLVTGSSANFQADVVLDNTFVNNDASNNKGSVKFGDVNVTVNKDFGTAAKKLASVEFGSDSGKKVTKLGADIHAASVSFKKQTVDVASDSTVNGNVEFNGSSINLAKNKLTSAGGKATLKGAIKLSSEYGGNAGSGQFVNSAGQLDFADGSSLEITVTDVTDGIAREDAEIVIIDNKGSSSNAAKAMLASIDSINAGTNNNNLIKWTPKAENGGLKLVRENIAKEVVVKEVTEVLGKNAGVTADIIEKVLAAKKGTNAGNFADSWTTLTKEQRAEALDRIQNAANLSLNQVNESLVARVAERMGASLPIGSTANYAAAVADAGFDGVGVAAGDDHDKYGIWGTPFFGTATQKSRKGAVGYKADSFGVAAGFDVKANEDLVLGAAFTYANSEVKHKDGKRKDKTKVDSYLGSLYGMQQLTPRWFLQGSATMGTSNVENKSNRVGFNGVYETATGKYSSMLFTGEVMAGYNYAVENVSVVPMAGFKFTRVNDGGYKETGSKDQNLDINKKAANKFEVVGGLKIAALAYDMNNVQIRPEVHGFVSHDLVDKNPDARVKMGGAESFSQNSAKPITTFFNVGAGVETSYNNMDYGVSYDANIGDKYVGHQGSLKIRVNF